MHTHTQTPIQASTSLSEVEIEVMAGCSEVKHFNCSCVRSFSTNPLSWGSLSGKLNICVWDLSHGAASQDDQNPLRQAFTLSESRASLQKWGTERDGLACWWLWREGLEEEHQRELDARLIPHCHYPHFLATVCELPHNEGHFQGFAPGTGAKFCSN